MLDSREIVGHVTKFHFISIRTLKGEKAENYGNAFYMLLSKLMKFSILLTMELGIRENKDDNNEKWRIFKFWNSSFWPFNYIYIFKARQIICFPFLLNIDFVVAKLLYNS